MRKIRTWLIVGALIIISIFTLRPFIEKGINKMPTTHEYAIDFVDDSGYRIRMDHPAGTIISLYSAHTENLFSLGVDREIIGVGKSDIFPYAARQKTIYDYRSDPEKVIAARPDVVIIRPFIERHSPDFVNSLRRTGINVVSLYPDNFEEFDEYIYKLSMITGREKRARKMLEEFHKELSELESQTKDIKNKVGVYFESSDIEYKTVTPQSMAANAIKFAGGRNVADDAVPIEVGSSIVVYGTENIIKKADEIDFYVTQRGVMGAGGNLHSISIRPGFDTLKAIKEGHVVEINQKIISSPTFRYIKGVKALQRAFYPEIFCKIDIKTGEVTRQDLSEVLVKYLNSMIFVPTKSYYRKDREHYYGNFKDVEYNNTSFDYIETAVRKSYFKTTIIDEEEFFYPDDIVTREQFAEILYIIKDLEINDFDIKDLDKISKKRIVMSVVHAGLMNLEDGYFYPEKPLMWEDVKLGLGL